MIGQRLSLRVEPPFELAVVAFGHGWIDLSPNAWEPECGVLRTAARVERQPTDISIRQSGDRLLVATRSRRRSLPSSIRRVVQRMLRLDEDLSEWWNLCRRHPDLDWAARRGAGRLLRAPTLFEDLAKLLLTTNCSWSATRSMVDRLVAQLGETTPLGARAFPSSARCARLSERFYRDEIRAGYRSGPLLELARRAARGALADLDDPQASTDQLRAQLLALPGFGPYAAGQALRLLGRYEDLALDSWCRAKLAERAGGRTPSDTAISRRYARYGMYRGLALWVDLTRTWHEGPTAAPLSAAPRAS